MYKAELKGKTPPNIENSENSEDLLASNIFSFFSITDKKFFKIIHSIKLIDNKIDQLDI